MEICYVSVSRYNCLLRCGTLVTEKGAGLNVSQFTFFISYKFKKSCGRSWLFYYFDFPSHFLLIWNILHCVYVHSVSAKIYDLHCIRRFPENVTIPNDVGQISNCYFYFRMILNALYTFKCLPVWSVYTINKLRKNPVALDSKCNWLSSLCNRTWKYETFVAVKRPHYSFFSTKLKPWKDVSWIVGWRDSTSSLHFNKPKNNHYLRQTLHIISWPTFLFNNFIYFDANANCRDILQLRNSKFWNTVYCQKLIFGLAV